MEWAKLLSSEHDGDYFQEPSAANAYLRANSKRSVNPCQIK